MGYLSLDMLVAEGLSPDNILSAQQLLPNHEPALVDYSKRGTLYHPQMRALARPFTTESLSERGFNPEGDLEMFERFLKIYLNNQGLKLDTKNNDLTLAEIHAYLDAGEEFLKPKKGFFLGHELSENNVFFSKNYTLNGELFNPRDVLHEYQLNQRKLERLIGNLSSPRSLELWWQALKGEKKETARNHILQQYLPTVKYLAERYKTHLPDNVELDDLISAGVFGLLDAINSYDPSRNFRFETFCIPRIRGAMADELRKMDWVPRSVRYYSHKLEKALTKLEGRLGRKPTNKELASHLRLSHAELYKLSQKGKSPRVISLSRKVFETDSGKDILEADLLKDEKAESPYKNLERKLITKKLNRGLNPKQRSILRLYYHGGLTMKKISELVGLNESRVSQIHSEMILMFRQNLSPDNF